MTTEQALKVLNTVAKGCALYADSLSGSRGDAWANLACDEYDKALATLTARIEKAEALAEAALETVEAWEKDHADEFIAGIAHTKDAIAAYRDDITKEKQP